jgi:hypothetical protein
MTATVSRVRMYKPTGDIGKRLQEAYQLQADIAALEAKLKVQRDFILMHMEEKARPPRAPRKSSRAHGEILVYIQKRSQTGSTK